MIETVLVMLLLLQLKHLFEDFFWKTKWMVMNKGRYGHPGGLVHAGMHAGASAVVLAIMPVGWGLLIALCVAEFLVHYHIDWAKEFAVRRAGASAADKRFWDISGTDQALQLATYVAMVAAGAL